MARETLKSVVTGTNAVGTTEQPQHKTLAHLLTDPKIKAQMALALPKHMTADRLARIALTEIRKIPKLAQCDQTSFLGAIMQVAALGLEPGGALGHAYLIPFDKRGKLANGQWGVVGTEVQLIIGYRGMIDLARRSGQIVSLSARVVYANDKFNYAYGMDETLEHVPHEGADPGEMTHVYAVAKLVGGGVQFEVMSRAKVERIRNESQGYSSAKKYAKEGQAINSPWESHFDEMAKKTVIRQLFKYLPVSIEIQRAVGLDEQADAGVPQHNALIIDGDYRVETHEQPTGDEQPRVTLGPDISAQDIHDAIVAAKDTDSLDAACDLINMLPASEHGPLIELYTKRKAELSA